MIIECCSQEKTFVRYYALLAARFCLLRKEFQVRADVDHRVGGDGIVSNVAGGLSDIWILSPARFQVRQGGMLLLHLG